MLNYKYIKCQYYYRVLSNPNFTGCVYENGKFIFIPYNYSDMRATPVVTINAFNISGPNKGRILAIGKGTKSFATSYLGGSLPSMKAYVAIDNMIRIEMNFHETMSAYPLSNFNLETVYLYSYGTPNIEFYLSADL